MTVQAETGRRAVRPPQRPDMRPEGNADAERAAARALELLESGTLDQAHNDKFHIDPAVIPDAWTYEWKRNTIYNQEDPSYQVELVRMGWEPVPAERHPEMMPKGWRGATIEREGMVLMQRPEEITRRVRAMDRREAQQQVDIGQKFGNAPEGQFERRHQGESLLSVKRHMEPMPIPDE
jgi:hypothetical protein